MNDPVIDEMVQKWHELDAAGVYGPHLEKEARLLQFISTIGQR